MSFSCFVVWIDLEAGCDSTVAPVVFSKSRRKEWKAGALGFPTEPEQKTLK